MVISGRKSKPIGYAFLIRDLALKVIRPHQLSFALLQGSPGVDTVDGDITRYYTRRYDPGGSRIAHLEFAIKHEGIHADVLAAIFRVLDPEELAEAVRQKPFGKYLRKLWFLHEYLTGTKIDVPDLAAGNYVPLLDRSKYFEGRRRRVRRQRIVNNLLGNSRFSPLVRRTPVLARRESAELGRRVRDLLAHYDPELVRRAVRYLYTKETRSSFAIERETPSASRMDRFIELLRRSANEPAVTKVAIVEMQNAIVDPRFAASDYRDVQNYVGEAVVNSGKVHYVSPRPEDVPGMMSGLLEMANRLIERPIDAVVLAAAVAFGFVFIHPFEDGNGRLHRFLVHWVLSRKGMTPPGVILPVSAVMLAREEEYDRCLESFSRPLLQVIDYSIDSDGEVRVDGETDHHYRFFDATLMAEALYAWVEAAIEKELPEELEFLSRYRKAIRALQEIVDMPDRDLDLFIRLCRQNGWHLSERKRSRFALLRDDEIARLEAALMDAMTGPVPDRLAIDE